jgi:hypothetical protein
VLRKDRVTQVLQQGSQPAGDLDRRSSVLADLRDGKREEVGPVEGRDHHPNSSAFVAEDGPPRERTGTDLAKQDLEIVEHLHGGRGVVHGRRERSCGHVDHHPDCEGRILFDRPLDPEHDHVIQSVGIWTCTVRVDCGDRSPLRCEVARRTS